MPVHYHMTEKLAAVSSLFPFSLLTGLGAGIFFARMDSRRTFMRGEHK
mgnify:CR=1 FL=1